MDNIIAIKVIAGLDEAISHINTYGSQHSKLLLLLTMLMPSVFEEIDAAAVYVNASTRFTDGLNMDLGLRWVSVLRSSMPGPMGLKELTTIKYIIYGDGQVRE